MSGLSTRQLEARRERLAFERAERERELAKEDAEQFRAYVQSVEDEQRNLPPAFQIASIPFEEWRNFADPNQTDPVLRGQEATYKALLHRAAVAERQTVTEGKRDSGFQLPKSAIGKSATFEQARQINRAEFKRFKDSHRELHFSSGNVDKLTDFLLQQGVQIADAETYEAAWGRLESLGMLEQQPEPEPVHEQPNEPEPSSEPEVHLGIDPLTGREREYTRVEVNRMTSEEFKKAFQLARMWRAGRF